MAIEPRGRRPPLLSYATPNAGHRELQWYLIACIVLLGVGALGWLLAAVGLAMGMVPGPGRTVGSVLFMVMMILRHILQLGGWAACAGLFIYFTIWAYRIHEDIQRHTGGTYPISPAQACGFCYIPFFNLFWVVYMPYKLAEAIDRELGSTGRPTNPATVLVFQIMQPVANFFLWCFLQPSPILFALSMKSIQAGCNELVARSAEGSPPVQGIAPPPSTLVTPGLPAAAGLPPAAPAKPKQPPWGLIIGLSAGAVGLIIVLVVAVVVFRSLAANSPVTVPVYTPAPTPTPRPFTPSIPKPRPIVPPTPGRH
jgi:hypothetical protein